MRFVASWVISPKALDCGENHRFAIAQGLSAKITDSIPQVLPQTKAAILAAVQSGFRRAVIFRRRLWTAVSITALRWLCISPSTDAARSVHHFTHPLSIRRDQAFNA